MLDLVEQAALAHQLDEKAMEQIDRHGIGADIGQEGDLPCGNTHQEKDQPQQGGTDAQQAETPAVISRLIGYGAIQPGIFDLIHILRDHINQGAEQSTKAERKDWARRRFSDSLFQENSGRAPFSCCFRLPGPHGRGTVRQTLKTGQ